MFRHQKFFLGNQGVRFNEVLLYLKTGSTMEFDWGIGYRVLCISSFVLFYMGVELAPLGPG